MCLQVCPGEVAHFPFLGPPRALVRVRLRLRTVALIRVSKGHGTMTGGLAVIRRLGLRGSPKTDLEVAGKWR